MKSIKNLAWAMVLLSAALVSCKKDDISSSSPSNAIFKHPGLLNTYANFVFTQRRVLGQDDPWLSSFNSLRNTTWGNFSYGMQGPLAYMTSDPSVKASNGLAYKSIIENDAYAMYCHAVMYKLSRNYFYAERAVSMLNAWASTLRSIKGPDSTLSAANNGFLIANAAEILKAYDSWPADSLQKVKDMVRNVFYPVIKNIEVPGALGSVDAANARAVMAFGIFLDDKTMYDAAKTYFYEGKGNGTIKHYFLPSGQNQESGHSQSNAQLGLNIFSDICEMAYNQGDTTLWTANDTVLLRSFEYHAKYGLLNDVPFNASFPDVYGKNVYSAISATNRGTFRPTFYIAYNHFKTRLGKAMPFTKKVLDDNSLEKNNMVLNEGTGWGGLLYSQAVEAPDPESAPPIYSNLIGYIGYEFSQLDSWGGIGWAENSNCVVATGKLVISSNVSSGNTYLRATRGGITLDPNTFPYLAIRVSNIPKLQNASGEWGVQIYLAVNGVNKDFYYSSKTDLTLVPGSTDVYYLKWTPKLDKTGTNVAFPTAAGIYTGGFYLDFGNCLSGQRAKVNWMRTYKTITEIPTF